VLVQAFISLLRYCNSLLTGLCLQSPMSPIYFTYGCQNNL
jgi:hypothetical protein